MKVKELKKTVNVCWSPAETYPVHLAAGAAAQQVDASFSSSASLELYSLNFEDPGPDLEPKCSLQTQHKFHKIVWSGAGVIAGGCDSGLLEFYSVDRLLKKSSDALLGSTNKHNGHVSSLDVNPYQKNLLASGAAESEIFIWDLNNTAQPMAPGNRSQPLDPVQSLAWNQQVQHILGSTFATRCVVWDLRKNEPIMKLSDSQSRTRWRSLAWHPTVATQLCIASEDDQTPVIQLWDLRLAASPLVTLQGHQSGVMSLSWCKQDPSLLLSGGKDGMVLCWEPNNTRPGGELLLEVCKQQQWVFDAAWCPRDPALFAASSFDQQLSVHTLLGASTPESSCQTQSNIMESFGGVDSFNQLPAVSRALAPAAPAPPPQLPRPPRWLKRPVRAKFAFGGKLVSFEKCPQEAGSHKLVYISQVVSEPEIVERATELDTILGASLSHDPAAADRLAEFCREKGDEASDQNERYTWYFLRANFLPNFHTEVLNLLGFKQEETQPKANRAAGEVTQPDATLSRGASTETEAELSTDTSTDLSDAHTLIEKKLANVDLNAPASNVVIPNGEDNVSLICRALVCGHLEEAVELCLESKRITDALIIASLGSQELLYKVQKYHLNQTHSDPVSVLSGSLLLARWDALVESASSRSWRDTLCALVTHCHSALQHYCEMLGDKLSKESDPSLREAAIICYLCGINPDSLVARWANTSRKQDASTLAKLTTLALLARSAAAHRGCPMQSLGKLEAVLIEYASRLAAQGCLHSALNILEGVSSADLRDRLKPALGMAPARTGQSVTQQPLGNRARTVSGQGHRRVMGHTDVSQTYSAVPAYEPLQPSPWGNTSVAAPPAPPAAAPAPPRPSSTGPTAGGLTSRSKYKVDPSVQSAPLYGQYGFNNTQGYSNPSQGYNNPSQGYNSPLPEQYGASSVAAPGFNPAPAAAPYTPAVAPVAPAAAPAVNGYYPPAAPARPVPPGWNDPPIMTAKPKPKQEVQAQAPITHPLFGAEPPQHVPLNPTQQYPGQQIPGQQYSGQQLPGQQYPGQQLPGQQYPGQQMPGQQHPGGQQFPGGQQYPGSQYSEQQYPAQQMPGQQYPGQFAQAYPQQSESPAPVAEAAAPVQKAPLPDHLASLQTALDNLRADCALRAANPQMKRKLEDVQKRLETLYDMLREYRLSESALSTLQLCVQQAQVGDLSAAVQTVSTLASGADFAAAASFLPALKVLFQLAAQLQLVGS